MLPWTRLAGMGEVCTSVLLHYIECSCASLCSQGFTSRKVIVSQLFLFRPTSTMHLWIPTLDQSISIPRPQPSFSSLCCLMYILCQTSSFPHCLVKSSRITFVHSRRYVKYSRQYTWLRSMVVHMLPMHITQLTLSMRSFMINLHTTSDGKLGWGMGMRLACNCFFLVKCNFISQVTKQYQPCSCKSCNRQ